VTPQIMKIFYLNYITPNQHIVYRAIPASQRAIFLLVTKDIVPCFAISIQYKPAAIN